MSMSRHEVNQLFKQMQERSKKVDASIKGGLPLGTGLQSFEARLKQEEASDAKPSVTLRHMASLTKHYLEELDSKAGRADPATVFINYNVAMSLLERGLDVQQAIKQARTTVRQAVMEVTNPRLGYLSTPDELRRMKQRRKADEEADRKPDRRKQAQRAEVPYLV